MADTLLTGTTLIESSTRSVGDVPVGGVIPWLSNLAGVPNLPVGWMLCDGSTVADALSSMNGTVIPDLNGDNRFLRGADTAGGTGGSETHVHNWLHDSDDSYNAAGNNLALVTFEATTAGTTTTIDLDNESAKYTNSISTLPTYMDVVWIIRIR